MLLPIKLICKKTQSRRDGTAIIKIQYCYTSEKRTELSTEIAIPPEYWSRKSCRISDKLPEKYGSPSELNGKLQTMLRVAQDIVTFAVSRKIADPLLFVKNTFQPDFDPQILYENEKVVVTQAQTNTDLFYQFDDFIASKQKKVSPGLLSCFKASKECLLAYQHHTGTPITFESFDFAFSESYIEFLTYDYEQRRGKKQHKKGLKANSIKNMVNYLRMFLKNRIDRRIIPPIDLSPLKAAGEEPDAIYLNREEITLIYQLDLSGHPDLSPYRDMLVLGCLTGLRYSDFSIISPEDIRGDMLYKKQGKTDSWVVVPLRDEAYEILVNRFNGRVPQTINSEFNERIREVGKVAGLTTVIKFSYKKGNQDIIQVKPKYEWMSSHTCRRSFCTNEFLAGTPVELIMKISGHKSLKDFYRYIRIAPEEAGQKMKERWIERGEMKLPVIEKAIPAGQLCEPLPLQVIPVPAVLPLPVRAIAS